jgi:hypothetical protein
MLFMPVDLFKPYVQGEQQAVKDNWTDLFNSEKLRQNYVQTDTAEGTEGSNIFSTNARNQYLGDQANRTDALAAAAQPGQLAQTGLTSDATRSLVGSLRDQDYVGQFGTTGADRAMLGLQRGQLSNDIQRGTLDYLAPTAPQLATWTGQNIVSNAQLNAGNTAFQLAQQPARQQVQELRTQGQLKTLPLETAYATTRLQEGAQALAGSGAAQATGNAVALANDQAYQRSQVLQQNAPQIANLMSFRGDSSTPENAFALQQHTDATNSWLRGQGLIAANQEVIYPPGAQPVINTYNADGSIMSTVPAVQSFDLMAAHAPPTPTYLGPNGRVTTPRAQAAAKQPAANPLVGGAVPRAAGAPLPTGTDYRRGAVAPDAASVATASPAVAAPPITEDQVNASKSALDALTAKKLALLHRYPDLLNPSSGRIDMPFEGAASDTPAIAIKALEQLETSMRAARQSHDAMRARWSTVQQAQRASDQQKAVTDLLESLK